MIFAFDAVHARQMREIATIYADMAKQRVAAAVQLVPLMLYASANERGRIERERKEILRKSELQGVPSRLDSFGAYQNGFGSFG